MADMTRAKGYQLELRMNVVEVDIEDWQDGRGPQIVRRGTGQGLTVDHTMQLGALDFMGVAKVLAELHDATNRIVKEYGDARP